MQPDSFSCRFFSDAACFGWQMGGQNSRGTERKRPLAEEQFVMVAFPCADYFLNSCPYFTHESNVMCLFSFEPGPGKLTGSN